VDGIIRAKWEGLVRTGRIACGLIAALAVSACAQNPQHQSSTFLDSYAQANPTPASFRECHGFACSVASHVSLSPKQWQRVGAVFKPVAKDAKTERRQVSQAVSLMHHMVGAQTGTAVEQWTHKNMDILPNLGDPTQLDCIDEAVNTWTYMTMMEKSGYLKYHRVAKLSNGGGMTDPRNTAVLEDKKSGDLYAVDPAVVGFGEPPPVIPLAMWLETWPPDLSKNNDAPPKSGKPHARPAQLRTAQNKASE
jgi:hypothetical protein